MKLLRLFPLILLGTIIFIMPGCINDDITTSPEAKLSFSQDTLSFDTIFTELGTPTARLLVYNRNSQGVNISNIRMRNADSNFSINVDGMSGKEFHDVEIRAKDSIYVFIECYIDKNGNAEPRLVEDQLEFVTNGNVQTVQVEAWGQNVTRLRGVTVTEDTRLTAEQPYVIFDSLVVSPEATLSIAPGARLLFHDKARMIVQGRLEAVGTPTEFIHMRGDRSDKVLPNLTYQEMASQWQGIVIEATSYGNRMEYVDMRSTEHGLVIDSCNNPSALKLQIVNSWLHNSAGNVLRSSHSRINAYGVCFSDAGAGVVSIDGGMCEFVQCTLANYYLFSAPYGPILRLGGLKSEESASPLNAVFNNCIIAGMGSAVSPGDLNGTNVFFNYTLFQANGSNDANFTDCIWGKDPLFLTDRKSYYFNYHVEPKSPALEAGNPAYVTQICLYDMDGNDRLSFGSPTLGAYSDPQKPQK